MIYERKTKDKFMIGYSVFDGTKQLIPRNFKSEEERDAYFDMLQDEVKKSRENPISNPFSQFNHYFKVKRRLKI